MSESITYDYIWQIFQKEKATNDLQQITKSFYSDVQSFISGLENQKTDESVSIKINTQKLITAIYERRKQKIMVYVAYGKQLPQPVAEEESAFYAEALKLFSSSKVSQPKTEKPMLRALRDIPEIFMPSGNKIGPAAKAEIITTINNEDAEYLVANKLCEIV